MFWGSSAAATRLMPPLTADIVRLRRVACLLAGRDRSCAPLKVVRTAADNLPVERRPASLAFLLAAALLLVAVAAAGSATAATRTTRQAETAARVVHAINALRASYGLPRLRVNDELADAARAHSLEMASLGYFSHLSADGSTFGQRVRRWYTVTSHWSAGENLVWGRPRIGGMRVVQLWLASPPHRANLVSPGWREVGCSAVHSTSAPGVFANTAVTVVTCDFGARS
jgi:uncharacterized protein YkwD